MWSQGRYIVCLASSWIARHQERLRKWEEAIGEHIVVNWEGLSPCGHDHRPVDPDTHAVVMRKKDYYGLRKNFE